MKKLLVIILVIVSIIACEQKKTINVEEEKEVSASSESILSQLQANINAHGGLELWKSFGSLYFEIFNGKETVKHTINLYNRNETFTNDSTYTVGYKGKQSWVNPDSIAFTNVRFYKNLYFYFFALPFVAADEGVYHKYLGQKSFNGEMFDVVKISYAENIGDSYNDKYILYINSKTKLLHMINYSVTYFDHSKSEQYNALVYDKWQNVNGLLVPKSFSGYKWENDTLGNKRYNIIFDNVSFEEKTPDTNLFDIPDNVYFE